MYVLEYVTFPDGIRYLDGFNFGITFDMAVYVVPEPISMLARDESRVSLLSACVAAAAGHMMERRRNTIVRVTIQLPRHYSCCASL